MAGAAVPPPPSPEEQEQISRALAERLNYRYLDHRLLLDYVREFGEVEANAPSVDGEMEWRDSTIKQKNHNRQSISHLFFASVCLIFNIL